jgi:uncharacterized coiled-coil DUF342 family protein
VEALRAEIEQLRAQHTAASAAVATSEDTVTAARDQLATALAEAESARAALAAAHAAHAEATKAGDELRVRVAELEKAVREPRVSVVPPVNEEVDELRAVIELQEQALAAASARDRARESAAPQEAASERARSYSDEGHFLFVPSTEGYELFERAGPSPAVGSLVELSGGRTCRVLRVGASPMPGARRACAYLEPA